jgi:hypothetical protein
MFETVDPVLISALSAIGGAAVVFIFELIKDRIQRKADSKEKFFYEVYPRRIALYEDVIKEFQSMQALDLDKIKSINRIEASEIIIGYLQTLGALIARLRFFGSANSVELLKKLCVHMGQFQDKALENPLGDGCEIVASLVKSIGLTQNGFIGITSEDVSDVIDERISGFLKKIGCKGKKKNKGGEGKEG